ncbi:MAG: hypothetical protein ABSD59_12875 [Terracidiphilus sp.]|jgi:hypothetical protein
MKQILHIFQKDVRRLWIEILLAVTAAALFAWVTPKSWLSGPIMVRNPYQEIASLVCLLVLLGWFLLIARLIHGEVLVGDRQFWITRPYEWPKLLAAKALFVALFIYLPFLLMEAAILLEAGFNPLPYIPGLLYRLLLISLIFSPLIGLAAVTSNLARMVLTILGVFVAFIIVASTTAVHFQGNNGPVKFYNVPLGGLASIAVVLGVCGAVVVLQYAQRRVLVARLLLGSTPFLVLLTSWACNINLSVDRAFPPAAQTDASIIRMIAFEQDGQRRAAAHIWGSSGNDNFHNIDTKKWTLIKISLRASGVTAGDRWQLDAFRPTLAPANGAPVKLDWQPGQNLFDKPDDPNTLNYVMLAFLIPRSEYERLKSSPLTLHLDFALTQATPARTWRFSLPKGDFMIPDLGSCSAVDDRAGQVLHIAGVFCRFPLRMPSRATITALQTRGPCELAPAQPGDPALPISSSIGDFGTAPASFGISPMEQGQFLNAPNYTSDPKVVPIRLCPGTPVVVTQYRKVRAVQTGITIENFSLQGQ